MDLALIRQHLRIDEIDEDGGEDLLLQSYWDAAKAHVEMHCDRKIVEDEPTDDSQMTLTPDVSQAILLLIGHWYANRESVVVGSVPAALQLGFESLLWYRKRF